MIALDRVAIAGLCIVLAAWFAFIVVMVRRSKPPADPATEAQRDRRSLVGIALLFIPSYLDIRFGAVFATTLALL